MQVFAPMSERMGLAEVAAHARRVEAIGYDGLLVPEAVHDGLLASMAALSATERIRVATSVLVAFPRSPMTIAHAAWDLQALSGGRFELGLGTQVRGNIVGRFSTVWESPVPRLREYVESLRAIFESFQTWHPLDYSGQHYRFDRLQPFFNPGPLPDSLPPPPIWIGAVGPDMTRMAGGTSDGLMSHPTNSSPRVLREMTRPLVMQGANRVGRSPGACSVMAAGFVVTGLDQSVLNVQRERVREQLSFLYSTPAYWASLEYLEFGNLGRSLHALSKEGRWNEMKSAVSDEILDALVPQATYRDIATRLLHDYGDCAERMTFPLPDDPKHDEQVAEVVTELRQGS
jgi:probable F420-dependent oxidoreductase